MVNTIVSIRLFPARDTSPLAIFSPNPVSVTDPTIMPAQPQVTATEMALRALSSSPLMNIRKNCITSNRFSSRVMLTTQIRRHESIPHMAAFIAVLPPTKRTIITMTGKIIYQPSFKSCLTTGRCSLGSPSSPRFRASKCTLVKIPVK